MSVSNKERRQFLRQLMYISGGTALLAHPLLSKLVGIDLISNAVASMGSSYKALVCVFLDGGNDSANMLIPSSIAEYNQYANLRQTLAVERDSLLPITSITLNSAGQYGLHPSLNGFKTLFDQGKLSFVANVGPLVEKTTKDDFLNRRVVLPPHLFSHKDQKVHWQTANPLDNQGVGWAGRMADGLAPGANDLASNISIGGHNVWQKGEMSLPYGMNRNGVERYFGLSTANAGQKRRRETLAELISLASNIPLMAEYGRLKTRSINLADRVYSALSTFSSSAPITTVFPAEYLAAQLKMVTRMVQAQPVLVRHSKPSLFGWAVLIHMLLR